MAEVKFVPIQDIIVPESRFRKTFSEKNLSDLQESISNGPGLINAITLRPNMEINTGESRLKAITILHNLMFPVRYHGEIVPDGTIPAIIIAGLEDEISYLQAELHENTCRENFTFLEEAQAVAKIAALQQALINKEKTPSTGESSAAEEKKFVLSIPLKSISKEAITKTAEQIYDGQSGGGFTQVVTDSIKLVNIMENHPELAAKIGKAKDMTEAQKMLRKHAEDETRTTLARVQGKSFNNKIHNIIHGDCLVELPKIESESFDVCLTDPIYGINAGAFGNAAGKMSNFNHNYDDSLETFKQVLPKALKEISRILKPRAHIYLACDLRNYFLLREFLEQSSDRHNPWKIPNAPFIQYKIAGGRVPHPGFTPRRSYELWLYAYRGEKQEYRLINDVIECESDRTESHGAGKPKDLLKTFLNRSCMPGDKVIDFMAGSGSILPAAHELKIKCTAIEIDAAYYGRCIERLKELK